jgi:hypothetical protein
MESLFKAYCKRSLLWLPERGIGYYTVVDNPYDQSYFDKYVSYALTPLGERLLNFRLEFVRQCTAGLLLDVGIGCGAFVEERNRRGSPTLGFDVNPVGIQWLKDRDWWGDYRERDTVENVSLWDVLEHMEEPTALLNKVTGYVFCSLPIFQNADHVLKSKHFRRDEHRWYFTEQGLMGWMRDSGFICVGRSDEETRLGREDILTFAFGKDR